MATLEDRMLDPEGTKADNYCSSSEDEKEEDGPGKCVAKSKASFYPTTASNQPPTYNTGPKGVIEDWRRYKQLQNEQQKAADAETLRLAKKLSMTCRTAKDDERARLEEEERKVLEELEEDEDDFVRHYMLRRMEEMKASQGKKSSFGKLFELNSADDFLHSIEEDSKSATVIIHIYEPDVDGCDAMNGSLACVARDYPMVKICRVRASTLGTSKKFRVEGLPTLQAYRGGDLINNFVRITDEFGSDFFSDEVESFLRDYGVLPDPAAYHAGGKAVSSIFGNAPKIRDQADADSDCSVD